MLPIVDDFIDWLFGWRVGYWKKEANKYKSSLQSCIKNTEGMNEDIMTLQKKVLELENELSQFRIPVPASEGELKVEDVKDILKTQLEVKSLLLSDRTYKLIPRAEMERFLREDKTDLLNYVSEYFDCDDFAARLMGMVSSPGWAAIAFGEAWILKGNGKGHAVNCFVDSKSVCWLIEPQNDKIFRKPNDWEVNFVKM